MPCYHPLKAFRCANGGVVFSELARYDTVSTLWLPCGRCIGCRLERSRQWAMRCMHEASLHERNSFVTLTYDDDHLPYRGMLEYPAFQLFMKRLRKATDQRVRFFMCGEYGSQNWRPHYHACLFGKGFDDMRFWRTSDSGARCYRSAELERLWPFGNSEVGAVTFESAGYCARYCVAKRTGADASAHYRRVDDAGAYQLPPEFAKMSLKPGIGAGWFNRFKDDVYNHDYVVVRGREMRPPKYYDRLYGGLWPAQMEEIKWKREQEAARFSADNTDARLAVKEQVQLARAEFLKRS